MSHPSRVEFMPLPPVVWAIVLSGVGLIIMTGGMTQAKTNATSAQANDGIPEPPSGSPAGRG